MSLLAELNELFDDMNIPCETGIYSDKAPDRYAVFIPLNDDFPLYAGDLPEADQQEVRIALYARKGTGYTAFKNEIISKLIEKDITITERRYIDYETDTGYHHYNIDVAKVYDMEELIDGNDRS